MSLTPGIGDRPSPHSASGAHGSVLVINSGSSSLKYQLVDPVGGEAIASGLVERIGEADGRVRHTYAGSTERTGPIADTATRCGPRWTSSPRWALTSGRRTCSPPGTGWCESRPG